MAIKQGWTGRVFEDLHRRRRLRARVRAHTARRRQRLVHVPDDEHHPIHLDAHYAAKTEFGRPLMNSCFTLSLVTGQSVADLTQNAVANLGWDEVRLPHPVFEGDTIYSSSEVLETRESQSRPNAGLVRVRTTGVNQDRTPVIVFTRTFMSGSAAMCRATDNGRTATPRKIRNTRNTRKRSFCFVLSCFRAFRVFRGELAFLVILERRMRVGWRRLLLHLVEQVAHPHVRAADRVRGARARDPDRLRYPARYRCSPPPTRAFAPDARVWRGHARAVDERQRAARPDESAPGAFADQRSDAHLLEVVGDGVTARAGVLVGHHHFRAEHGAKRHHVVPRPRGRG